LGNDGIGHAILPVGNLGTELDTGGTQRHVVPQRIGKILNNIKCTQINILCIEKIAIFAKSNLIDLFILT